MAVAVSLRCFAISLRSRTSSSATTFVVGEVREPVAKTRIQGKVAIQLIPFLNHSDINVVILSMAKHQVAQGESLFEAALLAI